MCSIAVAVPRELDEFCPNCGEWVVTASFNYDEGWCIQCAPRRVHGQCTSCGGTVTNAHRSMCKACREEAWLTKHADELEYLVVTKGYTVAQARRTVANMVRPICHSCGKVIKNGNGKSYFCKQDKKCHAAYNKYRRLVRSGLRPDAALAVVSTRNKPREVPIQYGSIVSVRASD